MIFPEPLPDEFFCSLLSRLCRNNGVTDFRDVTDLYFGKQIYTSFIDAQISIPDFCHRTKNAYGNPTELLERFTWLQARVRLGEIALSSVEAIENGVKQPSLGDLTFLESTTLSYCPACFVCDIQTFGVTYWHRVHQLSVVRCCPRHGVPIVRVGIKRAHLHKAFPLPGDLVLPGVENSSACPETVGFWRGVSVTVDEILSAQTELSDHQMINSAFLVELRARMLTTKRGLPRPAELSDLFGKIYVEGVGNEVGEAGKLLEQIVSGFIKRDQSETFVLGRAVLVYWLFGNWRAFREKCQWVDVFGSWPEVLSTKTMRVRESQEIREHHRRISSTYKQEHPSCSRLDLTKAEYRSFRWLLHNDRVWLDREFPIPPRSTTQLCLFEWQ